MAFLTINGWKIPISTKGASRSYDAVGKVSRSQRGSLLDGRRAQKRVYEFETTPLALDDANGLEAMLSGMGDLWRYDHDLWSTKGVGVKATSTTAPGVVAGKFGKAIDLTSGKWATYPLKRGVLAPRAGTLAAWVYVDDIVRDTTLSRSVVNHSAVDANDGTNDDWLQRVRLWKYHGTDRWVAHVGATYNARVEVDADVATYTPTTGWYHLAMVWRLGYLALFIDGARVAYKVDVPEWKLPQSLDYDLDVGHNRNGSAPLSSKVDDLIALPYAMSDAQVKAIADEGSQSRWFPPIPAVHVVGDAYDLRHRTLIPEVTGFDYVHVGNESRAVVSFKLSED